MTKKDIIDAWAKIRSIDNTIPDDVLDFMKDSALEALVALDKIENDKRYKLLSQRIFDFLDTYAKLAANYKEDDGIDEKYNSPDAYHLLACAELLQVGKKPLSCWSEYDQGGYKRTDEGRTIHNQLITEIYAIVNGK